MSSAADQDRLGQVFVVSAAFLMAMTIGVAAALQADVYGGTVALWCLLAVCIAVGAGRCWFNPDRAPIYVADSAFALVGGSIVVNGLAYGWAEQLWFVGFLATILFGACLGLRLALRQ